MIKKAYIMPVGVLIKTKMKIEIEITHTLKQILGGYLPTIVIKN